MCVCLCVCISGDGVGGAGRGGVRGHGVGLRGGRARRLAATAHRVPPLRGGGLLLVSNLFVL